MVIVIIIVIILLLFIIFSNSHIEPYDSLKNNYTISKCADTCKVTNNCKGFGYNKQTNNCFLSNIPLFDITNLQSKYSNKYNKNDTICNKITPVENIDNTLTQSLLMNNSAYNCINKKEASLYLSKDDLFKKIKNLDNLYREEIVSPYEVKEYDWEKEAYMNDLYYNKEKIFKGLLSVDPIKILKFKNSVTKKEKDYKKILNEINDINKEYIKYDNFNIGDYLHPYHCINDINLKSCMMKCKENERCIGFEHNPRLTRLNKNIYDKKYKFSLASDTTVPNIKHEPSIEILNDLCCMKQNVGPFVERTNKFKQYKTGNFYLKSKYDLAYDTDYNNYIKFYRKEYDDKEYDDKDDTEYLENYKEKKLENIYILEDLEKIKSGNIPTKFNPSDIFKKKTNTITNLTELEEQDESVDLQESDNLQDSQNSQE